MDEEILLHNVRLHYIYCIYSDSKYKPVEEVREFFSVDVGEDFNVYNLTELAFCLSKDGEEYVKLFDDDSPFAPWNRAFKRSGSEFVCYDDICYFGINYYDALVTVDELKDIQDQIEKRRNELCLM